MQNAAQQTLSKKTLKTSQVAISKRELIAQAKPVADEPKAENNLQRLLASCCDCV
ncbi:MAG: hypothetical protein HOO90_02660 [Methylotenera sp.]|uniref:hypothetical protein n=1 Tax=Methylotenera sp. TaxID=2051956 RepID=UPI0017F3FC75|nr:hypothetical protein [Methylotenera sp.]NOU24420.1 hypothetical protein [Methylotenera sp.]